MEFCCLGGVNALYQITGMQLQPVRDKLVKILRLKRETFSHKLYQMVFTFCLIDLAWVFFRTSNFSDALQIIKSMLTDKNIWILFDGSLFKLGLDQKNFLVMLLSIALLIFADYMKYKGVKVREIICRQELWFRWLVLSVGIAGILTFGAWGSGYNVNSFIYFQF